MSKRHGGFGLSWHLPPFHHGRPPSRPPSGERPRTNRSAGRGGPKKKDAPRRHGEGGRTRSSPLARKRVLILSSPCSPCLRGASSYFFAGRTLFAAQTRGGWVAGSSPAMVKFGDSIQPKTAGRIHHAAFSRSDFHAPVAARPFICARCVNAFCAAGTFSGLPLQAFCGAACSARP